MDGWVDGWVWVALGMALAGGLHCAGMCGGFAVLAQRSGSTANRSSNALARFAWYGAGKTLTYVILGVVAGGAGALMGTWSLGSRALAIVVGLFMVGAGLQLGGWFAAGRLFSGVGRVTVRVADRLRSFLRSGSPFARFGLGMTNGLLPCGLLYAALAAAAGTGGLWQGGVFMAIFGIGTLPALGFSAWIAARLSPRQRVLAARLGGVLLILFGLVTLMRGFPGLMGIVHDGAMTP